MPCTVISHTMEDVKTQYLSNDSTRPSQSSNNELNTGECEWLPGDILWARIGRHPFWPCIVVVDPQNAMYFDTKRTGRSSQQQVHVQYFGDNGSRSWVTVNQIMKFSGKNNLLKFAETKKKDKRYSTAFPQPGKNQKWDLAVQEAEEAALKSRNERILFFEEYYPIFTQDENDEEKIQVKEKVSKSLSQKSHIERKTKEQSDKIPDKESSSSGVADVAHKTKKRVLENEVSEDDSKSERGKSHIRKVKRRKTDKKPPGVFEVFVDRCANLFAIDRPDFQTDRAKCIRFMRAMWSSMTEEEKSRYHGSYEDIESLKEMHEL